jgi:hypothetical protein
MLDPTTGWFEIQHYDDKQSINVANIVEQECGSQGISMAKSNNL